MIKFNFNGDNYQMRNLPTELTINEFEYISEIMNNTELDYIDKFFQIFEFVGLPIDLIEELDGAKFIQLTKEFTDYQMDVEFIKEIEIDGYTYIAFEGDEFSPKVKDLKYVEKFIKRNPNKYVANVMAVLFKRSDLTKVEHYDEAHIKHKANLFKDLNYSTALPYIAVILQKITINMKNIAENGEQTA